MSARRGSSSISRMRWAAINRDANALRLLLGRCIELDRHVLGHTVDALLDLRRIERPSHEAGVVPAAAHEPVMPAAPAHEAGMPAIALGKRGGQDTAGHQACGE